MSLSLGDIVMFLKADTSNLDAGLQQSEKRAESWSSKVGGFLTNAASFAVGGLLQAGISSVGSAIGTVASSMISGNAAFEGYEQKFTVLLGSADAAKQRLADLAEFGQKTPFELPQVVSASTVLQGFGLYSEEAAKKFGFAGEEIMTIAGDVASGTGASFEDMSLLIGKFSAGATGEAISRMQELGITNRDELTKMGLEFSKSGQLLSPLPESMEVILKLMKGKYGGLMDAQSTTFDGMKSNLADWMAGAGRTIGKPIFDALKDNLKGVLEFLGSPMVQNSINVFAQMLGDGIGTAMSFIQGTALPILTNFIKAIITAPGEGGVLLDYLQELPGFLQPVARLLAELAIWVTGTVIPGIQTLGDVFMGLIDVLFFGAEPLGDWSTWGEKLSAIFGKDLAVTISDFVFFISDQFIPALQDLAGRVFNEVIPAIVAFITPIIEQVMPGLGLLAEIIMNVATFVLPLLIEWWNFLIDNINIIIPILAVVGVAILALTSPISLVIGAIVLLASAWANNWGGIQEKTQAVIDFLMPYISQGMTFIQGVITSVLTFIQEWWKQHGDSVMVIIQALWSFLVNLFNTNLAFIVFIVTGFLTGIKKFWDDWGATIMAVTAFIWEAIKTTVQTTMDFISFIIDLVAALITADWEAFGEALQTAWNTAWEAIKTAVTNAKDRIIEIVTSIITKIKELFKTDWTAIGQSIIDGIAEGLRNGWDYLTNLVTDLANSLFEAAQDALGMGGAAVANALGASSQSAGSLMGGAGGTVNSFTINQTVYGQPYLSQDLAFIQSMPTT